MAAAAVAADDDDDDEGLSYQSASWLARIVSRSEAGVKCFGRQETDFVPSPNLPIPPYKMRFKKSVQQVLDPTLLERTRNVLTLVTTSTDFLTSSVYSTVTEQNNELRTCNNTHLADR